MLAVKRKATGSAGYIVMFTTVLILAIIILLPLIPVIAVALLIGAGVNEIIYRKQIRGK